MTEPNFRVRPRTTFEVTRYSRAQGSEQVGSHLGMTQANEIVEALAAKTGGSFNIMQRDERRFGAKSVPPLYLDIYKLLVEQPNGTEITMGLDSGVLVIQTLTPSDIQQASVTGAGVADIVRRELAARDADRDPMRYMPGPISDLLHEAESKPLRRDEFRALVGEVQTAIETYYPGASDRIMHAIADKLAQGDGRAGERSPEAILSWLRGKDDPRGPVEPLNVVNEAAAWALACGVNPPIAVHQDVTFNTEFQARTAYLKRLHLNPDRRNDLFRRAAISLYPDTPVDVARDTFMEVAALHPNEDERKVWGEHLHRESGQPMHEIMQWISTYTTEMVYVATGQPLFDPQREAFAIRLAWGDTMNAAGTRAFGDAEEFRTVGAITDVSREPAVAARVLVLKQGAGSQPIPAPWEQYARNRALGYSHEEARNRSDDKATIPPSYSKVPDRFMQLVEPRVAFLKSLPKSVQDEAAEIIRTATDMGDAVDKLKALRRTPDMIDGWVASLVARFGSSDAGAIKASLMRGRF